MDWFGLKIRNLTKLVHFFLVYFKNILYVGACVLADQCWVHKQEACGFDPRYGQRVVALSKTLNHKYTSSPFLFTDYPLYFFCLQFTAQTVI